MKAITALLITITLFGCSKPNDNDPALGFMMGSSESQWHDRVDKLIRDGILIEGTSADATTYKYQWHTKGGDVPAHIRFNRTGNLRAIYITYNPDTIVTYNPDAINNEARFEKVFAPGRGIVQLSTVEDIIKKLSDYYGKPDSLYLEQRSKMDPITQKYADALEPYSSAVGDTTYEHYYWHKPNQRIVFECWGFSRPNIMHSYRYVHYTSLTIKSDNFQQEENVADSAYYRHMQSN